MDSSAVQLGRYKNTVYKKSCCLLHQGRISFNTKTELTVRWKYQYLHTIHFLTRCTAIYWCPATRQADVYWLQLTSFNPLCDVQCCMDYKLLLYFIPHRNGCGLPLKQRILSLWECKLNYLLNFNRSYSLQREYDVGYNDKWWEACFTEYEFNSQQQDVSF